MADHRAAPRGARPRASIHATHLGPRGRGAATARSRGLAGALDAVGAAPGPREPSRAQVVDLAELAQGHEVLEVGERHLQAPGRGRGVEVLGPNQLRDDLEGGARLAVDGAAHPVEMLVHLRPVGADLGRHVAKGARVRRGRASSRASRLDRGSRGTRPPGPGCGRGRRTARPGRAGGRPEQEAALRLMQNDVRRSVAGRLVHLPGAHVGLDLHAGNELAVGRHGAERCGALPPAVLPVALRRRPARRSAAPPRSAGRAAASGSSASPRTCSQADASRARIRRRP